MMTAIEVVVATSFIGTRGFGSYRTKVLGLQQLSVERFARISGWYHKLGTRWKQTAIEVVVGNQLYVDSEVRLLSN